MAEAQTYLSKCISQKRSIYSNRTVSYVIVLLELLTVLLEYIDLSVIAILISKNSYYYTNILPIMLALCSMLSGIYYAHNYASIIGGSLLFLFTYYSQNYSPNIPGVIPEIEKSNGYPSAAENITACKHKNYLQRSSYSNRAVTPKIV